MPGSVPASAFGHCVPLHAQRPQPTRQNTSPGQPTNASRSTTTITLRGVNFVAITKLAARWLDTVGGAALTRRTETAAAALRRGKRKGAKQTPTRGNRKKTTNQTTFQQVADWLAEDQFCVLLCAHECANSCVRAQVCVPVCVGCGAARAREQPRVGNLACLLASRVSSGEERDVANHLVHPHHTHTEPSPHSTTL